MLGNEHENNLKKENVSQTLNNDNGDMYNFFEPTKYNKLKYGAMRLSIYGMAYIIYIPIDHEKIVWLTI